nr:hypothetical protein [Caldisericia bacterium]
TMEKELNENPDLLLEAENYKEDEETEEYPEIYEFWAVDDWLYDELKDAGEVVFEDLDFKVWGRQGTGQAIYMDYVIQGIAESLIK